jgi:hypothetical protein
LASPFLVSTDRNDRQGVAAPGPRKKMNGSGLARLQKLLQRLIPDLTGFFPGAKLTARLFHGKANSFAVNFPGVSFWWRAAMFYVHPKFSI